MPLVKATVKQRYLDLYALAKSTEMTDDEYADRMADIAIANTGDMTVKTAGLIDSSGDTLNNDTTVE